MSFGSAKVSAGEGERCWTDGCGGRFYGLLEEDLDAFCPASEGRHLGCGGVGDAVFYWFYAFWVRLYWGWAFQFQLFQLKNGWYVVSFLISIILIIN